MVKATVRKAGVSQAAIKAAADRAETKPITTAPIVNEAVEAWKEAFKQANDRDLMLSDKTIDSIINTDQFNALESDTHRLEVLEKAEETAKKIAVSDPGLSVLVAKLEADEAAMAEIAKDVEAIMRVKVNKTRMYASFKRIFSKAELDAMPYPGTDKDSPWLGNHKPDTVIKTTNAGEIKTVWTNDFVSTMKEGKRLEDRLADLKKEEAASGASQWYKGWSKQDRKTEKSKLEGERNALRSMVRGAIEVHHCFEGIRGMPDITIRWCRTKSEKHYIEMPDGFGPGRPVSKITTSPKNIWIEPKDEGENGDNYTVSQLTAFDVQEAIRNGGTLAALKATVRKGTNDTADSDGDGSDMDSDQAYSTVNMFANYINKTANIAALRLILANPKAEHHKDWIENLVTIGQWADVARKQFKSQIKEATGSTTTATEDSDKKDAA